MKLHTLKPAPNSTKASKRVGRGQGSGKGGTSARGNKGAGQRSGNSKKFGFEGGQMPLQRRIPKFGFKNPNRVEYLAVNVYKLQELNEKFGITDFTLDVLVEHRLAGKNDMVKVLCKGELNAKINVTAHACSASAKEAIEAKGGTITIL